MRKSTIFIVLALLVGLFATGCTSQDGKTLITAVQKAADYRTYDCETEANLSVTPNGFDFTDESYYPVELMFDVFSNVSFKMKSSNNLNDLKSKGSGDFKVNNITGHFDYYSNPEKTWIKYPPFSKYLVVNNYKSFGFDTKEKYAEFMKSYISLTSALVKKYVQDYNYTLPNIKNNGRISFKTFTGNSSGTEIQIEMTGEQFKVFFKDACKKFFQSEDVKNFIIDVMKQTGKEFDAKEMKEYLDNSFEETVSATDEGVDLMFENVDVNNSSVILKYYIDNSGNLIKTYMEAKIRINNPDETEKQSVVVNFNISNYFSSINQSVNVDMPDFKDTDIFKYKESTIDFTYNPITELIDDYLYQIQRQKKSSFSFTNYEWDQTTRKQKKLNTLKSNGSATIRGQYEQVYYLFKNATVYVQADKAAKVVGAEFKQNGNTLEFIKNDKKLILTLNSKNYQFNGVSGISNVAPAKSGNYVIVPIKLLAEKFGAKLDWNTYTYGANLQVTLP